MPCDTAQNKLPTFKKLQLWSEKGVCRNVAKAGGNGSLRFANCHGREGWVSLRNVGWQKGSCPFLAITVPHQGEGRAWANVLRGEVCPQSTLTSLFFTLLVTRHPGPSMGRKQVLGRVGVGMGWGWEARLLLFCLLLAGETISLIDWAKSVWEHIT